MPPRARTILFVSSEMAPFVKMGGLADVVGALPCALRTLGYDVRVVLPLYDVISRDRLVEMPQHLDVPMGYGTERCKVMTTQVAANGLHSLFPPDRARPTVPVYFLDHPGFFARGYVYDRADAPRDNLSRFGFLSRGALTLCHSLGFFPDVVHVHDWPTALVPLYLNTVERGGPLGRTASVLTIHNLVYQATFPVKELGVTGLPPEVVREDGLLHNGVLNLLKGGLYHASKLTTVSPRYAAEIRTREEGAGLEGLLDFRGGDLIGILNGIDDVVWDPAHDRYLPATFHEDDLRGKAVCKELLQREMRLEIDPDVPLIGVVSRMTLQKGTDVIADSLERILDQGCQMVMLGAGESHLEQFFRERSLVGGGRFRAHIGYSEAMAHLIEAGSDLFLMPSRFEPCGLNQMYSQRYGTLPIVRATGGLDDTVEQCDPAQRRGTGFKMYDLYPAALVATVAWAISVYHDKPLFAAMQRQAMRKDQSWAQAAQRYAEVYQWAMESRRTG